MNTKDAYIQKIEAELELVGANLETLKAKAKSANADMQIKYSTEIENIEKNYAIVKSKLTQLGEAGEEAWEHIKQDIEKSWNSLRK